MRICDYLIHYLNSIGVKYVFGVDGANIEDIFDAVAVSNLPIKAILAKHEFCAAAMAGGYSQSSNSLGVVITTSGGGSLNAVSALGESLACQQPLLAILGMPPTNLEGVGAFQDFCGLNHTLNGKKLFSVLASNYFHRFKSGKNFSKHLQLAVKSALTPPFGTSVLMIPKDIQIKQVRAKCELQQRKLFTFHSMPDVKIEPSVVKKCSDARNNVLIIVGEGARSMHANNEVIQLIEKLNAWVAVTPEGKSNYKNTSLRFVGVTGISGHSSVFKIAKQVNTIIIIGTRLQLMSRAGLEAFLNTRKIIYINGLDICYQFSQHNEHRHFLIGDIKNIVRQILNALPPSPTLKPVTGGICYKSPGYLEQVNVNLFNFKSIFFLFNQYIKENEVIYADAGNTGGAALHYLKEAGYFGIALGMGGMGYAIGACIGSCFENGKTTWCFLGDGTLLMHGLEIHTAIEHQLPIRFIVFNNNSHAMCYTRDILYLSGKKQFNVFKKSNYGHGFAAMFPGFYSRDINTLSELSKQLNFLKKYHKPLLLSLNVDYHEIPPFLPFLQQKEVKKS